MGPTARIRFAIVIVVLWAISYTVAVVQADYTGVSLITPVMLMVAAYLFGTHRNGNGNGKQ